MENATVDLEKNIALYYVPSTALKIEEPVRGMKVIYVSHGFV